MRFLTNAKTNLAPRRHMTTAERRELQHNAAKDPRVERALQEVLADRPELRKKGREPRCRTGSTRLKLQPRLSDSMAGTQIVERLSRGNSPQSISTFRSVRRPCDPPRGLSATDLGL
jgi:hypothetical protein